MGMFTVKYKDAFRRGIYEEVHQLDEYVREIHESLKRSHESLQQRAAELVSKGVDEETQQEIAISFLDPEHNLAEVYPAMFSATTFVSIFSYFEHEMVSFAQRLHKIRGYKVALKDMASQGIEQAAIYLDKICDIKGPKQITTWHEIKRLQDIRNVIVHRRGILKEKGAPDANDAAIRQYLKDRTDILVDAGNTLVLTKDFCLHAIGVVRDYLLELIAKMPDTDTFEERAR